MVDANFGVLIIAIKSRGIDSMFMSKGTLRNNDSKYLGFYISCRPGVVCTRDLVHQDVPILDSA